jgi:hypothetical protein
MDYKIFKPRIGYAVIKTIDDETKDKVLINTGNEESRAMGRIIALPEPGLNGWKLDDLVVYNEYEGQELFKYGDIITEEGIIVIKEENLLLRIDESLIKKDEPIQQSQ